MIDDGLAHRRHIDTMDSQNIPGITGIEHEKFESTGLIAGIKLTENSASRSRAERGQKQYPRKSKLLQFHSSCRNTLSLFLKRQMFQFRIVRRTLLSIGR